MIFVFVVVNSTTTAQNMNLKFSPKKYQADLEMFITKDANLNEKEADSFFKLFREMGLKQRAIYQQMRKLGADKPTSPEQCKNLIIQRDKMDLELKKIQQIYHKKFLEVLSPCKVFNAIKAEEKFHRRQLKKWGHSNVKKQRK